VLVAGSAGGGEDDEVVAGAEGVTGSGHGLDGEGLAGVHGQRGAGEQLQPGVPVVEPQARRVAGPRVARHHLGAPVAVDVGDRRGGVGKIRAQMARERRLRIAAAIGGLVGIIATLVIYSSRDNDGYYIPASTVRKTEDKQPTRRTAARVDDVELEAN